MSTLSRATLRFLATLLDDRIREAETEPEQLLLNETRYDIAKHIHESAPRDDVDSLLSLFEEPEA